MTASAVFVAALLVQAPVERREFHVRPGPLLAGAQTIAAQGGVDVVVDGAIRNRPSAGLEGRMTVDQAFERLATSAGVRVRRLSGDVFRLQAAPPVARRAPPLSSPPPLPPVVLDEVVVTGSVQRGGLNEATGRTSLQSIGLAMAEGGASSDAVSDLSAGVDSTRQGSGRNKLFVRGVADSAFNGPLQSTTGQYLGDLRLTYGSPDPDLALIDIARVEVFEGPQGARFGAGSIGGVIRLHPSPPDLQDRSSQLTVGLSDTSGGAPGGDVAFRTNHPLGADAAARLVAYSRWDGGFLGRSGRGNAADDAIATAGVRGAVRLVREGWTLDLVALGQTIAADDTQTVPATERALAPHRPVAEPYRSTLALAGITASRDAGVARLTFATSLSRQDLSERFDATEPSKETPAAVDRDQATWALSSEFRAESRSDGMWSWTGGAALALGETRVTRRRAEISQTPAPPYGTDLDRTFAETAVFGEVVANPGAGLRLAFGGRVGVTRLVYEVRTVGPAAVADPPPRDDGVDLTVTPTTSVRWSTPSGWSIFGRFDKAIRPGGVSEGDGAVQAFAADAVTLLEAGVQTPPTASLRAQVSVGWMDWRDIQADIATQGGDLVTGNLGDGRIRFVSARFAWTPAPELDISGGLFVNDSRVRIDRPGVIGVTEAQIPNVAPLGGQLTVERSGLNLADHPLSLGANLRYVGRSQLGLGPGLDVEQGGYLRTELTARLGRAGRAISLKISNPFDVSATRYGIGTPYRLYERQAVPLRPLSLRLGLDLSF